jgi:NAD(P)-dependent dehydrogenase (short-subunit alcohol dehydrogenase family)
MKGIQDKIAVVTGGATGIGRATAAALIEFGAVVAIADIDLCSAKNTAHRLGSKCKAYEVDTESERSISNLANSVVNDLGGIDILVNGAAAFIMKGVEATSEEWAKSSAINIAGYALCAKYFAPSMIARGGGSIINICSISAHIAQPGFATYNASKGAIASLTRCMALDLARHNIRVNAVSPGSVWTDTNRKFHMEQLKMSREEAETDPDRGGKHVLKRFADPEEVAYPIAFLASDYSSFITGADLLIDGGYTIV